jgi:indolepyruvate ferredoxin oxidoreductase, beta subunit
MQAQVSAQRSIAVAIAALGGQGGGVVADWLTKVARREGFLAQSTSVPGVAQRTGSTIYYLELFPKAGLPAEGHEPVMSLMPEPGQVDLLVAAELLEAGRSIGRGLVTPQCTTLITSTHRDYTMGEKSSLRDGRMDAEPILQAARQHSKRLIQLDMRAIARDKGAHLSSVMLGCIAASGALPFRSESFAAVIAAGGFEVERNLAAFEAAAAAIKPRAPVAPLRGRAQTNASRPAALPPDLRRRIESECAPSVRPVVELGVRRTLDYQDVSYSHLYLDRLQRVARFDPEQSSGVSLLETLARALALWMSFEDTIRVADLKTRSERLQQVLREVGPRPGEIVQVTEFLKPRVTEICGTLPALLGRRIGASRRARRLLERFCGGRQVQTSSVGGFLLLRGIASLRRLRRTTLRFQEEDARIREWLAYVEHLAATNRPLAQEIVACQELVRGYGETHERGCEAFRVIVAVARNLESHTDVVARVKELREAASMDERGESFRALLSRHRYLTP